LTNGFNSVANILKPIVAIQEYRQLMTVVFKHLAIAVFIFVFNIDGHEKLIDGENITDKGSRNFCALNKYPHYEVT